MEENYVGRTLKNENNEEFVILSQVVYKNILCVYAVPALAGEDGKKAFFQVTGENAQLVSIQSPKMIEVLYDIMFKENVKEDKPRKIKEGESIPDYFAYLDEYYKSKVTTII